MDKPETVIDPRLAVRTRVLVLVLEEDFLGVIATAGLPLGIVIDPLRGPGLDPHLSHRAQDPLLDPGPDHHIAVAKLLVGTLDTRLPLELVEVVMGLARDAGEEEALATAATARGATVGLGVVLVELGAGAVAEAVVEAEREGLAHEGARKMAWSHHWNIYVMGEYPSLVTKKQSISYSSFANNNSFLRSSLPENVSWQV